MHNISHSRCQCDVDVFNKPGRQIMYDGDLHLKDLNDGKYWELLKPLGFKTEYHDTWIIVPTGFITDLASIPKIFFTIIGGSSDGKYRRAAVCHDWLYTVETKLDGNSKAKADKAFLELMLADGVPKWKAYIMYAAVWLFGHKSWGGK